MKLRDHPALLIVDMQNGFCHKDGSFAKLGMNVSNMTNVIPQIRQLLDAARTAHLPVIFTRVSFAEDYSDAGLAVERMPQLKEVGGFARNSWDSQVVDELEPNVEAGEVVIDKTRNNAFWNTDLENVLLSRSIDQLIVVGVGTNVCVEATIRAAFDRDYRMLVPIEANATLDEDMKNASLRTIGMMWADLVSIDDVLNSIQAE